MGTTLCNIHIYKVNPEDIKPLIKNEYIVMEISEGWTTVLGIAFEEADAEAKKLSKNIDAAVLSFMYFDDDLMSLKVFREGKKIAHYEMIPGGKPYLKNCGAFISEFGLEKKEESRLRVLFKCNDLGRKVTMLEELYGVAFYIDKVFLEADGEDKYRLKRVDELYLKYNEEMKRLNKIKNKTKAVITQETDAKLTIPIHTESGFFVFHHRDDNGIYSDYGDLVKLTGGELSPLLKGIYSSCQIKFGKDKWIINNGFGSQENDKYYLYDIHTNEIKKFNFQYNNQNFHISTITDDNNLLAYTVANYNDRDIHSHLMLSGINGKIIWDKDISNGQILITPVIYNKNIYLSASSDFSGLEIGLFKIDMDGNITKRIILPYIIYNSELVFYEGNIYFIGYEHSETTRRYVLIKMNESLETIDSRYFDKEISIFDKAVFDKKSNIAYYNSLNNILIKLNLKTMDYQAKKLDYEFYQLYVDKNNYIYGFLSESTICIFDSDINLFSRHRLKGNIYGICENETGTYVVTSTGNESAWGFPKEPPCIVRVYRIDPA